MTRVSVDGIVSKIVALAKRLWAKVKETFRKKRPGDLDEISDEELSAWYEDVREDAKAYSSEPEYHEQAHVANPTPLWRVREELRRAGYTAAKVREDRNQNHRGTRKHNEWHLTHPRVRHR